MVFPAEAKGREIVVGQFVDLPEALTPASIPTRTTGRPREWKDSMTTHEVLSKVEPSIRDALAVSHPGVVFTELWLKPRTSWCGSDMVDVWAVYDGDIEDLGAPPKPSSRR